jgi:hypothetical protein
MRRTLLLLFLLAFCTITNAQMRAGVARKSITPELPVWLSGYASRDKPSTEVLHDLWAKALVIEENSKNRVIIVTQDILGLSHDISEEVARRIMNNHGIDRSSFFSIRLIHTPVRLSGLH